jgi:hypothetical protein
MYDIRMVVADATCVSPTAPYTRLQYSIIYLNPLCMLPVAYEQRLASTQHHSCAVVHSCRHISHLVAVLQVSSELVPTDTEDAAYRMTHSSDAKQTANC